MNCERMRELIMTDYTDGEISGAVKSEVENHLNTCLECRRFREALQKAAVEPFRKAERPKAPVWIWSRIKERIVSERREPGGVLVNVRRGLSGLVNGRRPAFAVAAIAAVLLMAVIVARIPFDGRKAVGGYLTEQADFLAYLAFDAADTYNSDYADLGTSVEEYLL